MRRFFILLAVLSAAVSCTQPRKSAGQYPGPRSLELHLADYCEGPMPDRIQFQRHPNEMPLCAERTYHLDERDFSTAALAKNDIGAPVVSLCFSASGRSKFERLV